MYVCMCDMKYKEHHMTFEDMRRAKIKHTCTYFR